MDWAALEQTAYGPLSLKPDEFWSLTLHEFNAMVEGWMWRQDNEWRRTAQLAAWVLAPHVKKKVSAEDLYKGRNPKNKSREKYEESKAFFDKVAGKKS